METNNIRSDESEQSEREFDPNLGAANIGPLQVRARTSIWLIYAAVLVFNLILIGAIVLIALNRAGKL